MAAPRKGRRSGALWDSRVTLSEAAYDDLERLAEEAGRSRARHGGLLLEGLLRMLRSLGRLDARLLQQQLFEAGAAEHRRAASQLQASLLTQRKKGGKR